MNLKIIKKLTILLLLFAMVFNAYAAFMFWDGGGSTNNWSEPANWSTDAVPTSLDSVIFNNTSPKNCFIDVVDTIWSLNVSNLYTGTLDFGDSKLFLTGDAHFSSGGPLIASTGKLIFIGGSSQNFTPQVGVIMPAIGHDGMGTLRLQSNSLRALSFSQSNGSFDLNGQNIDSIVNDFLIINGNGSSFYASALSERTIKVRGNMSIFGTPPSSYVNMNPANPYTLAVEGALYADVCNIGKSTASISQGNASRSTNGGANTGWNFGTTKSWSGTGNWSNASNWGGALPTIADSVVFTSGGTCSLDVDVSVRALVFNGSYTGMFKAGNRVITVKDMADFRAGGSFALDPGFTIEITTFTSAQLIPKSGMYLPKVVKNGPGMVQKSMYPLKTDTLLILSGEFKFSSGTGDTIFNKLEVQNGKLDLMTANLRIAAPEVNFATPGVVIAENATLEFFGTVAQIFTPKPNMRFQILKFNKSSNGVTVQSNGFKTNYLYLMSGSLNLGNGLIDSIEAGIVISGGTTLNFGSSVLKVASSSVDFSNLSTLTAGTGVLEFTGIGAQSFIPKSGLVSPRISKKETGNLTISNTHLKSAMFVIHGGTVTFDSTFNIDTIEVQSGASVNFGGMGPSLDQDTVKIIQGNGELNFGYRKTVTTGNIDLSTFSNVFGMSEAGLIFAAPTPVSLTPRNNYMMDYLEQKGPGALTIISNNLSVGDFVLSGGTLDLGNGLSDSIKYSMSTSAGTDIIFNNSELVIGAPTIDFGVLSAVVAGTGSRITFNGNAIQLFIPKDGPTHPSIVIDNPSASVVCSVNALNGKNITIQSGSFSFAGASLVHTIDTLSGSGTVSFDCAKIMIKGDVDLSAMMVNSVDAGDTLQFIRTSGVQTLSPPSVTTLPSMLHTGNGTLLFQTNPVETYGFKQTAGTLDFNSLNFSTVSNGDLTIENGTSSSIANIDNTTISVAGSASFSGQSGNLLNLNSASPWNISTANGLIADFANIGNSNATGPTGITTENCTNSGNNSGWDFEKPTVTITSPLSGYLTTPPFFEGTANDDASGVDSVEIAISAPSGNWWHDGSWQPGVFWSKVSGTVTWSYSNAPQLSNEIYKVIARSYDGVGRVSILDTVIFTFDSIAPIASITIPINGSVHSSPPTFSGTAIDNINPLCVELTEVEIQNSTTGFYWNGSAWDTPQTWLTATGTTNWTYIMPALNNGDMYALSARSTDSAGNIGEPAPVIFFTFDNMPPVANLSSSSDSIVNSPFTTTVSFNEPVTGFDVSDIAVTNGTLSNFVNTMTDMEWTFDLTPTTDGPISINVNAGACTDFAGNPNIASETLSRIFDISAPVSVVTSPGNGGKLNGWPGIMGTAVDSAAGVKQVEVAISRLSDNLWWNGSGWGVDTNWLLASGTTSWDYSNSIDWSSGRFLVKVRAIDSLDNIETPGTGNVFAVDTTKPSSEISHPSNGSYINELSSVSGTAFDSVFAEPHSVSIAIMRNSDSYYWNNADWVMTHTWIMTDNKTNWVRNFSMPTLSDGNYTITSRATDSSGNQEVPSAGITVNCDLSAPTSVISFPLNGTTLANVTEIYGTSSDGSGSGVANVKLSIKRDSDNWYWNGTVWVDSVVKITAAGSISWTYNLLPLWTSGSYTVQTFVADIASNEGTGTATTFEIDNTAPLSTITFPLNGEVVNSIAFVTGTASDSKGISLVETAILDSIGQYYDGVSSWSATPIWFPAGGTSSWSSGVLPSLVSGNTYFIKVRATDSAGNTEVPGSGNAFTYDVVNPFSSVTSPADGSFFKTLGTISGIASDAFGVSKVELMIQRNTDNHYWNGSSWVVDQSYLNTTGTSVWSFDASFVDVVDGHVYSVIPKATDVATNHAQGNAVYFSCDLTAPVSTISSPVDGSILESLSELIGTSTDGSGSGISEVNLTIKRNSDNWYWDGTGWVATIEKLTATGTTNWAYSQLPVWTNGNYTVQAYATDMASNIETGPSITFSFDTDPPVSIIAYPLDASYQNVVDSITGTASDAASGVASVKVGLMRQSDGKFWNGSSWDTPLIWHTATGKEYWKFTAVPPLVSGTAYTIWRQSVDNAGNSESPLQTTFVFDNIVPQSSVTYPSNSAILANISFIGGTAYDSGYGINRIELTLQNSSTGQYWTGTEWNMTSTWLIAEGTTAWSYSGVPAWPSGNYTVSVRAIDMAGNIQTDLSISNFTIDNEPPSAVSITINDNGGYTNDSTPEIIFAATNADSMRYRIDYNSWSPWILYSTIVSNINIGVYGEGLRYIYAEFKDINENVSSIVSDSTYFDATPSISVITYPPDLSYQNKVDSITGTASDAASGVASVKVGLMRQSDGKFWNGSSWDTPLIWHTATGKEYWKFSSIPALTSGIIYTVLRQSIDNAGNTESTIHTTFRFDDILPQSGISNPLDSVTIQTLTKINGTAFDSGFGLAKVELSLQSDSTNQYWTGSEWIGMPIWHTVTGRDSWSYSTVPPWTNTGFIVRTRAVDFAGNIQTPPDSVFFTIDNEAPYNTTVAVEGSITLTNVPSHTLNLLATGADSMRFQINSEGWTPWELYAAVKPEFTINSSGDGLKNITAQFKDKVGNLAQAITSIRFDGTPPSAMPIFNASQQDSGIFISWTPGKSIEKDIRLIKIIQRVGEPPNNFKGSTDQPIIYSPIPGKDSTKYIFDPSLPYNTPIFYGIVLEDSAGNFSPWKTASVTLIINNTAPRFTGTPSTSATQDMLYSTVLTAIDDQNDLLSFSSVTIPSGMNLTPTGNLSWTPTNSNVGTHLVVVRVTDGQLYDTLSFTLTVANINDPPKFITSTIRESASQDQPWTLALQASDPDIGDSLVFSFLRSPSGMTISGNRISWTPRNKDVGTHPVTVKVTDAGGLFDTLSFSFVVNNVNDAPEPSFVGSIKVNFGAIKVSFKADDIDRHIGLDSVLEWECVVKRASTDSLLYHKSGTAKDTAVVSIVFAPFYNDSLIVELTVSDSTTSRSITSSASVSSMNRYTFMAGEWHMASLPAISNLLPSALLDTSVMVYKWLADEKNYKLLESSDTLKRGNSVWIYGDNAITLNSPSQQPLRLMTADKCTLQLNAGWNMLTSPFAFAVRPSLTGSEKLFAYSTNGYVETPLLEPWKGCFYYSASPSILICNGTPDMADTPQPPLTKLYKAADDWRVRVIVKGEDGSIDAANWLGVSPDFKNSDAHKPPPSPLGGVTAAFNNNGKILAQSIQIPQGTNEWLLSVNSDRPQMVMLTFDGLSDLPNDYYAFLCNGTDIIEITNSEKAEIKISGKRMLRVVITTDPLYAQNQIFAYELAQNNPNPFNPNTNISFAVPLRFTGDGIPIKSPQSVSLKIYDTGGRLVKILVHNELGSGRRYSVVWNGLDSKGRPVSSGVYVYRINIGPSYTQSRYMVISR